jgi:hypothetical protein
MVPRSETLKPTWICCRGFDFFWIAERWRLSSITVMTRAIMDAITLGLLWLLVTPRPPPRGQKKAPRGDDPGVCRGLVGEDRVVSSIQQAHRLAPRTSRSAMYLRTSQTSVPQRSLQLSLRDRLLPKYSFEEPFEGFHSGGQLHHLRGGGFQVRVTHVYFLTEALQLDLAVQLSKVNRQGRLFRASGSLVHARVYRNSAALARGCRMP